MDSKLLEGFAMIVGMWAVMFALFGMHSGQKALAPQQKTARRLSPGLGRLAYIAFGTSLLAYGFLKIILRSA